jgi:hypothetical protein
LDYFSKDNLGGAAMKKKMRVMTEDIEEAMSCKAFEKYASPFGNH